MPVTVEVWLVDDGVGGYGHYRGCAEGTKVGEFGPQVLALDDDVGRHEIAIAS